MEESDHYKIALEKQALRRLGPGPAPDLEKRHDLQNFVRHDRRRPECRFAPLFQLAQKHLHPQRPQHLYPGDY